LPASSTRKPHSSSTAVSAAAMRSRAQSGRTPNRRSKSRHRLRQSGGLHRIRRTLQPEQQRQQGIAADKIILANRTFVRYLIAHRRIAIFEQRIGLTACARAG
jgi:hypothetical protein